MLGNWDHRPQSSSPYNLDINRSLIILEILASSVGRILLASFDYLPLQSLERPLGILTVIWT